jgi:hypothetical protein
MFDCLEFLLTHQNPDGGWGYQPTSPSSVEATAWALMALAGRGQAAPPQDAMARARAWLLETQLPEGAWPAFAGQRQGCWTTSLATLALERSGKSPEAEARGINWLLDAQPADARLWWRLRMAVARSTLVRQDGSLHGWSWTPGTASWIEPTSFVLLLLGALPQESLPARATKLRRRAERMLYDRMCEGGGWNSGNPLVYGVAGVPRIGPTVWALLAMIEHAGRKENQLSLDWLERSYAGIQGPASLALAHRCLTAYGRPVPPLAAKLRELYAHNHFFESVLTAAWIVLAARPDVPANEVSTAP